MEIKHKWDAEKEELEWLNSKEKRDVAVGHDENLITSDLDPPGMENYCEVTLDDIRKSKDLKGTQDSSGAKVNSSDSGDSRFTLNTNTDGDTLEIEKKLENMKLVKMQENDVVKK